MSITQSARQGFRPQAIISDDLPEIYIRRLLGHRITDSEIFSRTDALRRAEHNRNTRFKSGNEATDAVLRGREREWVDPIAELDRAHERLYAPQLGIVRDGSRIRRRRGES